MDTFINDGFLHGIHAKGGFQNAFHDLEDASRLLIHRIRSTVVILRHIDCHGIDMAAAARCDDNGLSFQLPYQIVILIFRIHDNYHIIRFQEPEADLRLGREAFSGSRTAQNETIVIDPLHPVIKDGISGNQVTAVIDSLRVVQFQCGKWNEQCKG